MQLQYAPLAIYTVDGIPPDGTPVEVISGQNLGVTVALSVMVAGTGLFMIICFLFNVLFRNKKYNYLLDSKLCLKLY